MGVQATRYAGTKTANLARAEEKGEDRLEARHLETAVKLARTLGEMKGAAMKLGQLVAGLAVVHATVRENAVHVEGHEADMGEAVGAVEGPLVHQSSASRGRSVSAATGRRATLPTRSGM